MPKSAITLCNCESSRISGIGYDPATKRLAIRFKNKSGPGNVYEYANVPPSVHEEFMVAESKGKFFGSVIQSKNDEGELNYPHTKIEAEEPAA